jgi:hypothetical protein
MYRGPDAPRNLHDAVVEIGLASAPLLLIPRGRGATSPNAPVMVAFNPAMLALAAIVFAVFALTQGRGLGG